MRGQAVKTPERVAEVQAMRDRGMVVREIANRLGVARSTVQTWLNDPNGTALRERKKRYEGACERCGGRVSGQGGVAGRSRYCIECGPTIGGATAGAMASERVEPRRQRMVELWAAGASLKEIAADAGTTVNAITATFARMRQQGYDLPHRYVMTNGRRLSDAAASAPTRPSDPAGGETARFTTEEP